MQQSRFRTTLLSMLFAAVPVFADQAAPPPDTENNPTETRERRGVMAAGHHHLDARDPASFAWRHPDLHMVAEHSGMVFDGVLVHKHTFTPPGTHILVTDYTFDVREWFQGDPGKSFITIREAGGLDGDDVMTTCRSHRMDLDGRFLVFVRKNVDESLIPFNRILQVMDQGQTVADEQGRIAVELHNGRLITRTAREVDTLDYAPTPTDDLAERTPVPPPTPDPGFDPLPPQSEPQTIVGAPIPAEVVFQALRPAGAVRPAGPEPIGHLSQAGGADWLRCGYIDRSSNFRGWLQDNNNFNWTNTSMIDWNNLADNNHRWIFGYITSGGDPIRNQLPNANDGNHNIGVPTSAQMISGGYGGGWPNWNNANGLCFRWYVGAASNCGRIRETDVFANPSIASNELQFRKTMVHELGHALGFNHEDRFVAIMVSGTWRVPPNYSSTLYNRMDETIGGRAMLNFVNSNISSGTWLLRTWRDLATISQSHPNWGSSGDVGPHMTRLSTYSASTGQQVSIQRMYVENRGNQAFSNNVTFRVYLSTTTNITASDHLVWSGGWPSYPAHGFSNNFDLDFTIPAAVPTGNYYIGWILTSAEAELQTANNTGLLRGTSGTGFSPLQISINQVQQTGACCFTLTGTCAIRTAAECSAQLGSYAGNNVTCAAANCPQAGACCFADGSCGQRTAIMCALQAGNWAGANVTCAAANCPQPGACCLPDGTCQVLAALNCSLEGGNYIGDGTTCAGVSCPTVGTPLEVPPFNNTFSSASLSRGMWFEAPADFIITGLRVPDETDHGLQNIEVVRLNIEPPLFSNTTNDFVSLARHIGVASSRVIPANIHVNKGDIIGILGSCGDATMMHNSYSAVNSFESSICGQPTTLRRLGMQFNLVNEPAQSLFTEANAVVSRIEVFYAGALGAGVMTTLPPNNGRSDSGAGTFFDLKPHYDMAINGFEYYSNIPAGTHAAVEIWTRSGSYVNFIGTSSGWTLHERVDLISKGSSTATPVHLSKPLRLSAGQTTGVYYVGAIGGLRYFGTGSASQPNQGNAHLSFYGEHARGGPPWSGPLFNPRAWSGSIYYTLLGGKQVVPTAYASTAGNTGRNTLMRDQERKVQFVVGAAELTGVPVGTPITGVSWRSYTGASSAWPATDARWHHYEVSVATSVNPPSSFSTTFASNIGADNVVVRCGPLTIPAGSFTSGGNPNTFGFELPFTKPFVYKGGDIVFTIRHTGNMTGTAEFMDHLSTATPGWAQRFYYIDSTNINATTGAAGTFPVTRLTLGTTAGKYLLLGADNAVNQTAVRDALVSTGILGEVEIHPTTTATPTLAELQQYDAVLTWTNLSYVSGAAMGNVLADYVDAGGGVVVGVFAVSTTTAERSLRGRWETGGYDIIPARSGNFSAATSLGTVHLPSHALWNSVSNFTGAINYVRATSTTLPGHAVRIADWDDGRVLVATSTQMPRRVDLNFWPGAWHASQDGARVMANALLYAGSGVVAQPCYADCNGDQMLSVDDFTCFINAFASAQGLPVAQQIAHYANCDGNTNPPILTVDDFTCFINAFAQGCP